VSVREQRGGLVFPSIVALAGFAVLIALGTWQIERKAWKEALIETLTRRAAAEPVALPTHERWAGLNPESDEFRRVIFRAEFIHTLEAFVYTVGSALRPDISGPGYWVFTPARLPDGGLVIVNRGFVPQDRLDTHTRAEGQILNAVDVVGALRWSEPRGLFTPNDDPQRNVWYVRDHRAIAAAKGLGGEGMGGVAPYFIDQEAPQAPGGLPQSGALNVRLRNDHLQYALTWYGLAVVLAAVFTIWARGCWRTAAIKS
jgi:surfeit locus 1 family protein